MKCTICRGPWHPTTGFIVGHPVMHRACGACWKNDIIPLIKESMGKRFRVRKRGPKRYVSFYEHVGSMTVIGNGSGF